MKSIEELINNSENQITETQQYDNLISKLQEAKENNIPLDEGLFGAIVGGVAGVTIIPKIMKALCNVLGIQENGQLGSLLTSKLVMGAIGTKVGLKI